MNELAQAWWDTLGGYAHAGLYAVESGDHSTLPAARKAHLEATWALMCQAFVDGQGDTGGPPIEQLMAELLPEAESDG